MAEKLTGKDRADALATIPGWKPVDGRNAIHRTFRFSGFNAAFGFMTRSALAAEKLNHHPEWSNVYKTVDVTLSTHSVDGLSELDIKMARFMDRITGGQAS